MTAIIPNRLAELEAVIEGGMQTFVQVGTALAEIRDQRLYKATHSDFDAYCQERWGFSRRRAGQMIEAATIADELGTIVPTQLPANEGQARELARVAPEHRAETWQAAVRVRGADVTARDVRQAAQVLETARKEPDGATLVEQVKTGNWDLSEIKKELKHRGVEWNPPRAESRATDAEEAADTERLLNNVTDPDDLRRDRMRLEYFKDAKYVGYLTRLDPEFLAECLERDELPGARSLIASTRLWLDRLEQAIQPRGLRVVS
jgi:hypothetical protein